ncbi:MAG: HNH endonuclease [Acidimicrobiales bacterium mtb01]|nr:HNH endonuclease [Actinomycetota bacterium]TEX45355.1 MAG: HNH endonuclease [Acidimicrobiales bacterium mtb01]
MRRGIAFLVLLFFLFGSSPVRSAAPGPTPLQVLETLVVAPEDGSGYNRSSFKHWIDGDRDGCDTRREVLIAESLRPVRIGSRCSISGGQWFSVYDGRSTTNSSSFDIDHVVALKEAWDSGAKAWTAERRQAFANDLGTAFALIAVSASSNRSKGDRDPAEWMPARREYWCQYAIEWVGVKATWSLSVDPAEKTALARVLVDC